MFKYLLMIFVLWCQIYEYASDQTEEHRSEEGDTTKLLSFLQNSDTEIFSENENAEKNMTKQFEVDMNGNNNYHIEVGQQIFYIYGAEQVKKLLSNIISNNMNNGVNTIIADDINNNDDDNNDNNNNNNKNNIKNNNIKNIPKDYSISQGIGAHKFHLNNMSWNKARQTCIEEGGHLAVINSDNEENILLQMMKEKDVKWVWIGAHDLFEEGDWVTVTGESIKSAGYSKWTTAFTTTEPNNHDGKQHCATLVVYGGMDDFFCNELRYFFCEIPI